MITDYNSKSCKPLPSPPTLPFPLLRSSRRGGKGGAKRREGLGEATSKQKAWREARLKRYSFAIMPYLNKALFVDDRERNLDGLP